MVMGKLISVLSRTISLPSRLRSQGYDNGKSLASCNSRLLRQDFRITVPVAKITWVMQFTRLPGRRCTGH